MKTIPIDFSLLFSYSWVSTLFWAIAFLVSLLWGLDGIRDNYDIRYKSYKYKEKALWIAICSIAFFLSDFLSGLLGWGALYILLALIQEKQEYGTFEIFLGIIAVAGISGHGYKLSNWLGKNKE